MGLHIQEILACPTRGVCMINFREVWTSKIGVRGITPQKLVTFDPFVNSIMVILVNFLDFFFFLGGGLFFLGVGWVGGTLHPLAPSCIHASVACVQLKQPLLAELPDRPPIYDMTL